MKDLIEKLNSNLSFLNAVFDSKGNFAGSEDSFEIELIDFDNDFNIILFVCHDIMENEKPKLKHVKEHINIYQLAFRNIENWLKKNNFNIKSEENEVFKLYKDSNEVYIINTSCLLEAQIIGSIEAYKMSRI